MIKDSIYHQLLRVSSVVICLSLVMISGILYPATREISSLMIYQMASAIGVTVGVTPNELNVITAQLTEKERQLAVREASLREREIAVLIPQGANSERSTYILATLLFIILLLILLNYVLDFYRARQGMYRVVGNGPWTPGA